MRRMKRRTFAGATCEQIVFNISDRVADPKSAEPRIRFKTEEERAKHRLEKSRRHHAQLVNTNFCAGDLYVTLTFDNEHEVHDFEDAKRIRKNYIARLRRACPDAVIFAYLGRGMSTQRIHMHMLVHGATPEAIMDKWGMGAVCRIDTLRAHNSYEGVDHGQDYTGLANYLFAHWTEEQGGHRWYMTRNARQPEREDARECVRHYSTQKPPIAPKGYILIDAEETEYGFMRFFYVVKPEPRHRRRAEKSLN